MSLTVILSIKLEIVALNRQTKPILLFHDKIYSKKSNIAYILIVVSRQMLMKHSRQRHILILLQSSPYRRYESYGM